MVPNRTAAGCLLIALALSTGSLLPSTVRLEAQLEAQEEAAPTAQRSRAETIAVGYLRTLRTAQREYKKKAGQYADSLRALAGKGSFTRRMAETDRGDYVVRFRSTGKGYIAELVPKQFDAEHPAFYMDETGVVRREPDKQANVSSPELSERSAR